MKIEKIFVGGWFQRTTLHLSEIYDFLKEADSPLDLDKQKMKELHDVLMIKDVEMEVGHLDCVKLTSTNNIEVKIFEDGLILLAKDNEKDPKVDIADLTKYYEEQLSPAISYIFSLGAPLPKELADIKTIYPYFLVLKDAQEGDIKGLLDEFGQEKYFEIKKDAFEIYRGDKLYVINNISEQLVAIEKFIQERIFLREFKGQLHRYLNLHRIIWEKIADVKEKGKIKGSDVGALNAKVESYAKTINLIDTRINQMGAYISTRESILKGDSEMEKFGDVLMFKYDTLNNTLSYVKDIWRMTNNYVKSALGLFGSIQAQSTEASVGNLAIITSMGVGATLMGLFSSKPPEFTFIGVGYFFVLAVIGYLASKIIKRVASRRMYEIDDIEAAKDIK